jgi:hypothetical protein
MLKTICCVLTLGWLMPAAAGAAVIADFSGGRGAPITFTLPSAVSYTITANTADEAFVFKGAAPNNPFSNSHAPAAGTITYSVNGGAPQPLNDLNSGFVGGDTAATDFYFFGEPFSTLAPGDVVVLSPGYLTTTTNITAAAPPSGSFTTFLTGGGATGQRVSADGVAVPEPGAGLLALVLPLAALARRRKRSGIASTGPGGTDLRWDGRPGAG